MGKDKKRKRGNDAEDDANQPPQKTQALENGDGVVKKPVTKKDQSDRRQIRSERKKKRDLEAKQNSLKKKEKRAAAKQALVEDVPAAFTTGDDIAAGQDFVSLDAKGPRVKKVKGKSPRSIRKAARQAKLEAQASEQEGTDAFTTNTPAEARFICFVGNLPYTVSTEQIAAHFVKLQPKSIRLMTDKKTGKCKGFAFLEFETYDKMNTCLKMYHHSLFDPDGEGEAKLNTNGNNHSSKSKVRKINVELTAGGGGAKSEGRKDKIRAKNEKLNDERARDWEKKRKQEEAERLKGRKTERYNAPMTGANSEQMNPSAEGDRSDIHPSRLNRVRV